MFQFFSHSCTSYLVHNGSWIRTFQEMVLLPSPNEDCNRYQITLGARGGVVVEALYYKPEGHRIDSQLCHWNFSLT
jgi:hypothetical protein